MNLQTFQFALPDDPLEVRELMNVCRLFAERELEVVKGESPRFKREHFSALGSLGITGLSLSEEYGGSNLGAYEAAGVSFELARAQLGPSIYLSVHLMVSRLIARFGSAAMHPLVKLLASGEKLGAFCLTEAEAGSDAAGLKTEAVREAGGYRLHGEKIYITSGSVADVFLVFARTGEHRTKGISAFVVERGAIGLSNGAEEKKMGCEGAPITSVHFESCYVDESARLGEEGEGLTIALFGLGGGRVNIAASACGLSSKAIALTVHHLNERRQFSRPLAAFQGLQFLVADMVMNLEASLALTREAARALDRGDSRTLLAPAAKCFATDRAMEITTDAVQAFGGAGYLFEFQVEQLMRDAKMLQIVEGTNQIQRSVIARAILGTQES